MASQRFPTRIYPRATLTLRYFFGVRPDNAYVELDDAGRFVARFGWFRLETPVDNIVSWRIEGPWRPITALGVRMSIRHRDVTFGGSPDGGVRVDFREHPKLAFFHPPALYVTVDDLEGLAAALTDRGVPGQDARTRVVP